jgi:DNA-3-methyladenine glycosylase
LDGAFFARDTVEVARALVGVLLVHGSPEGRTVGRVVETEAYLAEGDPASHAHRGPTPRNASMFARAGTAYVFRSYGLHRCLNVVTAAAGVGEAVLLRALEPLAGLELMARRRGREGARSLCSGPGKLAQAMGVGLEHDGACLLSGDLRLHVPSAGPRPKLAAGPRVGISKAVDLPLRFRLAQSPFVSRS